MSKKKTEDRPYMGLGVFQPDSDAAPGTTIVGGQPDGQRRKGVQSVPVGLEQLLITAALDRSFREVLVRDRVAAAARRGLELTESERSVLSIAPAPQLEAMIDRIDTSEQNLKRRGFLRAVAATVVTLAAGTGIGACGGPDETKSSGAETGAPFQGPIDTAVDVPHPDPMPPTGIRPDDIPEAAQPMAGVMPQEPEPDASTPTVEMKIEDHGPTKGVRPDYPEAFEPPPKPKQPKVDVKPPKMPTRGHTKH